MNDEIKKYLDSANFKFKDIDEKGKEVELTLSQVIENLVENNKKLGDYITNLQEENERLNENNQAMQKEITRTWEKLDKLKQDNNDLEETRILQEQIINDYKSRIDKVIEYINTHEYPTDYGFFENDLDKKTLINILQGSD